MAYDGNGTFLPLPAPTFPAQPGKVIYAEYFNANLLNIHQGLTAALPRNGEAAMAGPLRMAGFKLTELGAGSSAGEAVEWGQWQNSYLNATYQVLNVPNLGLTPDGTRVTNVNWVDGQFSARFPNLSAPVLANATEINYLIGLTSDIQSQLSNQVAGPIHVATAKTTPTDADELGISDSAASWGLKKLTFANLAAWARGIKLSGLSIATNTAITASDTVLDALGKLQAQVSAKQGTLVSGTNIKTVNGSSLLGSGDLSVDGGVVPSTYITSNTTVVPGIRYIIGAAGITLNMTGVTWTKGDYFGVREAIGSGTYTLNFGTTKDRTQTRGSVVITAGYRQLDRTYEDATRGLI